jgi:ubiquinone/menaquinone biosynthesis C-methylase UbiE
MPRVAQTLSGAKWRSMVRVQWSEAAAAWDHWEPFNVSFLAPVNPVLLSALGLAPGQKVLDFGCGTGDPALEIARWVGSRGRVTGIDVATPMLEVARRRARLLGVRNAIFRRGDVTRLSARGRFDRVTSRFGLMFADDVPRALEQVRTALKPRGRAAFAVWGPPASTPAIMLAADAVRAWAKAPPPDPEVSPHPMRLGRPGRLAGLMRRAGFRDVREDRAPCYAAFPTADAYVEMMLEIAAPVKAVYDTLSSAHQRRVRERLRRGARRHRSGRAIRIPGFAWVVSGRR